MVDMVRLNALDLGTSMNLGRCLNLCSTFLAPLTCWIVCSCVCRQVRRSFMSSVLVSDTSSVLDNVEMCCVLQAWVVQVIDCGVAGPMFVIANIRTRC
jgi:hypothetical protein